MYCFIIYIYIYISISDCSPSIRYNCGSTRPCSQRYIGTRPFSEPEAANIRHFFEIRPGKFKLFINFHSYVEMWLTPWGYTPEVPTDNADVVSI